MFNPFDMLQGQGGAGMQGVGQQFGLTPEQTRRAMEALMPAFALGLQRDAGHDPAGLLKLFTSPMLSQAVIRQAATASGVGGQALRQMLPMMAGMVVASVVHMLLNQPQAPLAAARPEPEPANPFLAGQAFWADMMKGFLPTTAEPAPAPAPRPEPSKPPRAEAPAPGEPSKRIDVFQQMLLTGAEVQEENVKAMKGIFDAFWTDSLPARSKAKAAPARARKAAPKPSSGAGEKAPDAGTRSGRPGTLKRG